MQVPDADRSTTPEKPDLMWTAQIEAAIAEWRSTGAFPFPSLALYPAPVPQMYSHEDLRLIYHIASVHHQLAALDANNFTLWTRHIPTYVEPLARPCRSSHPPYRETTCGSRLVFRALGASWL